MKIRIHTLLLMLTLATVVLSAPAYAQTPDSLAKLPEADGLLYINAQRLVGEALPRVIPETEYAKIKGVFDQLKQIGIDVAGLENAVVALRFPKVAGSPPLPDILLAVRGSFNADAMISLGRMRLQGKYREEKHGTKTVTLLKLSELIAPGGQFQLPSFINDLAATALNANTLVVGNPMYVKAAIDAEAGGKRISADLAGLVSRDASALLSAVATFPPGALTGLMPPEVRSNEEVMKIISGIDQVYLSVGMDSTTFPIALTIRTANAEQARTISGFLEFAIRAASAGIKDPAAKGIVDTLKITTQNNEVQARIAIAQATVATLIQNAMKLAPPPPPPPPKKPVAVTMKDELIVQPPPPKEEPKKSAAKPASAKKP